MYFITLGSQKFQFNRLLIEVDKLIEKGLITCNVFAQIGHSDYTPRNFQYERFLEREKFIQMEENAEVVITHGGTGAIIGAVKKGKKVLAVPRLARYGEHVDDHQLQLLSEFEKMNIIGVCYDLEHLHKCLNDILTKKLDNYKSNTDVIINNIQTYLDCVD